jgi:subtilisin family serine protease
MMHTQVRARGAIATSARTVLLATAAIAAATGRPAAAFTASLIAGGGRPRSTLGPAELKLDTALRRLVAPETLPSPRPSRFQPAPQPWQRDDALHVRVRLDSGDPAALDSLVQAGFREARRRGDDVEGWLPAGDVPAVARLPGVRAVRPVLPGRLRATADGPARADLARATGYDGSGVVVGVISDGPGALPASVVPAGCTAGSGSEGQAMIEIVRALAPGVTVLFSEGLTSSLAFIDSVACLRAAGGRVIVDDIGFYDEPFFEDGPVAQAVRAAVQAGVSFHSAAGNDADRHYEATFQAAGDAGYHDFGGGSVVDNHLEIDVDPGQELDCILQWENPFGGSSDDYDLEVYDMEVSPPDLISVSENRQTGTQDPLEWFAIVNVGGSTGRAGVAIRRVDGQDRRVELFCFGGNTMEYLTAGGSIVGHAAVTEAVAVGAIAVDDPGLDSVEPYSSQGPVEIAFPAPETRDKPDLVAFDGVSTFVPGFSPFFGTSAAAPDTAAVAALLLQKNGCRTPAQIQSTLIATAADVAAPRRDPVAGAGRLDALAAITATDTPSCTTDAECDDGNVCTTDVCAGCTCEHREAEGFDALACLCEADLSCTGSAVLDAVRRCFKRACRLGERASHEGRPRQSDRLLRRASRLLSKAQSRVAQALARGTLEATCADALGVQLGNTRLAVDRLRDTL